MVVAVKRNRRNNFWQAIISAVASIGTAVAKNVIASQEAVKPEIDYLMYNYVYMEGASFDNLKYAYATLYRTNSNYFVLQYNYWAEKRVHDIKNGTHDLQKKATQSRVLLIIFVCIVIAIIILIFRNIKK